MSPACIYCGSSDTQDCGTIVEPNGPHHIECGSCGCAFPWQILPLGEHHTQGKEQ